ncbi:MAG: SAP36-like protein [Candidatus Phytoplasma pruni]|nr:MAG: SAP36-like protein [Candidatus Phytoplasma pruni]
MAIKKKNPTKPLSKTRKLFNCWLVIAPLLTVVTISSLWFKNHFQTQDQKETIPETINNEKQECLDLYIDQIKILEENIKIKEEELKDKELTTAYKNALTTIKELKEKQKKQIKNIIDFKNYLKQLENKIKNMEQKIKKSS